MGVSICQCKCNKDSQNIPTSYTNYPLVDETNNNNRNKKRNFNKYFSNNKVIQKIRSPLESQNKNVNIININKDNSQNYSSSCLNNIDTNKVFDNTKNNNIIINNIVLPQELDKEKTKVIKNFDKKIKEFAEYISEEEFKEKEDNPIIQKLEEFLQNNIYNINDNININKNNSDQKIFTRQPLLFKKDKSVYKGSWNYQGKKEGFGIYIDSNGNKYKGNWSEDQFNGEGILLSINGDFYKGDFTLGKIEGNGVYHSFQEKYNYFGEFKNNKFHGKGKIIYDDHTTYEGNFSEGYFEGEGNLLFVDGSYYKGSFEKNKFNGKGKFFFENGRKYFGDWKNNAMDGTGIFTWDEDTKYKGEYKNNKREGNGVYSFGCNLYDGYWINNLPHGKGTLLNDGLRIEGNFRYGKIVEITESKGANRDIIMKFTMVNSRLNESSAQQNVSKKTMPKVNMRLLEKKNEPLKQYKSNKNLSLKERRKSKDKSKSKSKEKSKKKHIKNEE